MPSREAFAIEFDEAQFGALMKSENEKYSYAVLQSGDVHYEQHESHFDSQIYSGVAREMIYAMFDSQNIDVSAVTGRADLDKAMVSFHQICSSPEASGFSRRE